MSWTGMSPEGLIQPMGCRECGIPGPHGWQHVAHKGWHRWVMPTQRQIKYRMIRRRKHHAATRWVPADRRTSWRKWHGVPTGWDVP